jgi:hypothetical protein
MRTWLLSVLFVAISANAAEFTLGGKVFKSKIEKAEKDCGTYSVLIETDRFPYEVEERVPNGLSLRGFAGSDTIVGAKAYLIIGNERHELPDATKKYQEKGFLLNDARRTFIPASSYCIDSARFLISVWSGGNCADCEGYIEYRFSFDGKKIDTEFKKYSDIKKYVKH